MKQAGIRVPKPGNVLSLASTALGAFLIIFASAYGENLAARIPIPPNVATLLQLYLKVIGAALIFAGASARYVMWADVGARADSWLAVGHRAEKILSVMLLVYTVSFVGFTVYRHNIFNSAAYDLGIQDQVVWNTSQGRFFEESIEGTNYLGDHFQPLMALLALPYRIYPSVYWLFIFQTVCLALGGIPVFRLARRQLHSPLAGVVFALLYLIYPAVGYINRFDFHFEVVAIPLLLAAWDALAENNWKLASLWLALALFGKEEMGLTIALVGVAAALIFKRVRFGAAWFGIGIAFSLTALFVLIPAFRGEPSDTLLRYGWLGRTPLEMLRKIVTDPVYVLKGIQQAGWFYMFTQLFGPVAFLNLLSPASLLMVVPGLAYNLLSSAGPQHTAYYQYVVPIIPGVFIGAIYGLSILARGAGKYLHGHLPRWKAPDYQVLGLVLLLAWGVLAFVVDNPIHDNHAVPDAWIRQPNEAAVREALALVPADAQVFTINQYGAHLAHRRVLKIYAGTGEEFGLQQADTAFLNLRDFRIAGPDRARAILAESVKQGFGLVFENDGVVILQRRGGDPRAIQGLIDKWLPVGVSAS